MANLLMSKIRSVKLISNYSLTTRDSPRRMRTMLKLIWIDNKAGLMKHKPKLKNSKLRETLSREMTELLQLQTKLNLMDLIWKSL